MQRYMSVSFYVLQGLFFSRKNSEKHFDHFKMCMNCWQDCYRWGLQVLRWDCSATASSVTICRVLVHMHNSTLWIKILQNIPRACDKALRCQGLHKCLELGVCRGLLRVKQNFESWARNSAKSSLVVVKGESWSYFQLGTPMAQSVPF